MARLKPNQLAVVQPGCGYADGQTVCVIESLPNDRVRITYGKVDPSKGIIVPEKHLRPNVATFAPQDGDTSADAARTFTLDRLTLDERLTLEAISEAGADGLTDFELAARTGRKQTSLGVRRGALVKAGMVVHNGLKRDSDTGTPSKVWEITEHGLAMLRRYRTGAA